MNTNQSKTFCILPWIHLNVMPDSTVLPCCISPYEDIYGDGNQQTIDQILNGSKFKNLRLNMLNNLPNIGCSRCYKLEDLGFRSMRMEMNESFQKYIPLTEKTLSDGSITDFSLKYVDIRFSNLCNFKCRGCGPALSSSWYEDHQTLFNYTSLQKKLKSITITSPDFWKELKALIPYTDIVYFGGGEPLITKEHFEILSLLISLNLSRVELRYNTNLSSLNYGPYNLTELWSKFEKVSLGISIDDIGPRAEYFRHGTKWEVIEKNLKNLQENNPNVNRIINCTVNIMNVFYLPEILQYILDRQIVTPENFNINLLLDPVEYRIDVLPPIMKKKVHIKLTKYKFFLTSQGGNYFYPVRHIENILTFLNDKDMTEYLPDFKKKTALLDEMRNENFIETFPELAVLMEDNF